MSQKLKRLFGAYRQLLGEIYKKAPIMVILTFVAAIAAGLVVPLSIFVNSHIFNDGLAVAGGQMSFGEYAPYLVLFAILAILPTLLTDLFIYGYVEPRSSLILRTSLRGRMLQKIKKMKYQHFESEASMEIIDKAYNRAEGSARHMFPMYVAMHLTSLVASVGSLILLAQVRWWLVPVVLLPFIAETWWSTKHNYNIYDEIELYWNKERRYGILGGFLRDRKFLQENKLNANADYLIDTY